MNRADSYPVVKQMAPSDVGSVVALESKLGVTNWNQALFEGEFLLSEEQRHWLVAEVDQVVVGFAGISFAAGESHILNLGVAKDRQRQGIATGLLKSLLEKAADYRVSVVLLEVESTNEAAIRLYESFGFCVSGHRAGYYGKKRDATSMKLEL